MTGAPALSVLERVGRRLPAPGGAQSSPRTAGSFEGVEAVEIVVPDRYCAILLLEHAAPLFPAQLVFGSELIVRLLPPPSGGEWVLELLALVERWLESAPLPRDSGDDEYLAPASTGALRVAG